MKNKKYMLFKTFVFQITKRNLETGKWEDIWLPVRNWSGVQDIFREHGMEVLLNEVDGVEFWNMPDGYNFRILEMVNHYSDGTTDTL